MSPPIRAIRLPRVVAALVISVLATAVIFSGSPAGAATAPDLGTAGNFAVLAGSTVTNTGPTVITGDVGVSPGTAVTGFPPGTVNGTIHAADAVALQAQSDLVIAYDSAASQTPDTTFPGPAELGGMTLVPGTYNTDTSFGITDTLTLDAQGDPDAVFIFQAGSTLITATDSTVDVINGGQACNVFWQVGSSATIEVGSTFVGTVMALTSITANTDATVAGRLLARNGAVTLDSNVITRSVCAAQTTTTTEGPTTTGAGPTTTGAGATTTTSAPGGPPSTLGTGTAAAATTTTVGGVVELASGPGTPGAPVTPGSPTPAAPAAPAAPSTPAAPATPATPGAPGSPPFAVTGANVFTLIALGVALLALGAGTVAAGPRKRTVR